MIYDLSDGYSVEALGPQHLAGPYATWFEDQSVLKFSTNGKFFPRTEDLRAFLEAANSDHRVDWAIRHTRDGHVGNVSLTSVSFIHRSAEFGILIGNADHAGCGVGERVARALFSHAFRKINLHRIGCGTAETNVAMLKLAKKLGMTEEGRRRKCVFLEGRWVDVIEFGLLSDEFRGEPA